METAPYLDAEFIDVLAISARVLWVKSDTADIQVTLKYKYSAYTRKAYPFSSPQ